MSSARFEVHAVYRTPTGRRCRIEPTNGRDHDWTLRAAFVYVDGPPGLRGMDGFVLTPGNYKLLRREDA